MDDDVISVQNSQGNWDVTIPNMGKDDLYNQIETLIKLRGIDENLQALIDVLWDVFYSMI